MAAQTNFELWAGDKKVLSLDIKNDAGTAVPLTDVSAISFVIKETQTSPVALLTKTVGSGIEVTDSAGGLFDVTLLPVDTEDLDGAYYWETVVTDVADGPYTAAYGYISIHGKTVRRNSYCTLEEALALIAEVVVNDNTVPNTATCQIIVETVAREIDGVLMGRPMDLPVTDLQALAFLKTINQYGACAAIIKSKKPGQTGMGGDQGAFEYYDQKYRGGLTRLATRTFTIVTNEAEQETRFSHGFGDETSTDTPYWTRRTWY